MAQPYQDLWQIRQQRKGAAWAPGQAGEACGKGKATTLVWMTPVEIKPALRSGGGPEEPFHSYERPY